jgi:xanthine/CO dehydrogenase XdhC/CoxF family maturation factor
MKEIQEILKKIKTLPPDEKAILATVVDVQGSSYRLPGAKMLILENGDTFGTVSGGCLEADVLERARQVLKTGEPQVFVYDTTNDLDSVFSLNMGCRGVIRILLEPLADNEIFNRLRQVFDERKGVSIATLIASSGKEKPGQREFWPAKNESAEKSFLEDCARKNFSDRKNKILETEGSVVFVEYLAPPTALTIFGAGADAAPLADIAKGLGWYVTLVDHREAFANKERFASADEIIISHPEKTAENIKIEKNSVVVLMTHNYEYDREILRSVIRSEAKYIGALGPKRRSDNILREFREEGVELTGKDLQKLHSPVGLDIGADTPEGIALSIVSEIQAVLKNREGGFLRNRQGSIYGRDQNRER